MFETENPVRGRGILEAIQTVSNNGASGRLAMKTGTTEGAFFFNHGLLVDARVGNLKGFQAINAAASMPEASLSFDPSVAPPPVSSIRPNERVILKQFFGIETIAPEEAHDAELLMPDEYDEVTLAAPAAALSETIPASSNEPSAEVPSVLPYQRASSPFLRGGLMIALLLVLLATTGVALLYSFGGQPAPASVAAATQTSAPPVAEQVKQAESDKVEPNNKKPIATRNETPAVSTDKPAGTKTSSATSTVRNDAPAASENKADDTSAEKNDSAVASDLTGKWNIVNTVSKTSYHSYGNMEIGFNLSIEQNGKGFTGRGQKISENGRTLPASSRTPIEVKGSINGDRVEATFYEQGAARHTNGRFVWRIDNAGRLTGTFNSTAARSSGKSTARKV